MKRQDINIRDPYVLVHENTYYLYGTRSQTTWTDAEGFDCYVSKDLEHWEGPIEIFKRSKDFFATQNFWAPEVYAYRDAFYMVTTLGAKDRNKGIYVLKAKQPTGPFELISGCISPEEWSAIDGTLYFEDDVPYLIFSHSFETSPDGHMCLLTLSDQLTEAISQPVTLFSAADAPWSQPIPFAKEEFGKDGDVYFTDGPSLFKDEHGKVLMLWSSWGQSGYAIGIARSESNSIHGPWTQLKSPIFSENGGHAMVFRDLTNQLRMAYHFPNDKYQERPQFAHLQFNNGSYHLDNHINSQESLL